MEKLTIKELAPYLPYGLKLWHKEYKAKHILDISIKEGVQEREMSAVTLMALVNGNTYLMPLLRPLSSLSEEIEHNGERFIPINNLRNLYGWDYLWYEVLGEITNFNVNKLKYACLKLLLEWHFDVFGLIDRGLALPIDGKEVK